MKKEMKALCIEGVATHDDPESCVGARKDAGEALTGARAGRAIEPRNEVSPGRPRCWNDGRQHRLWRYRESQSGPARSENHGMYGIFMRENR
ncbi:MAG: group II intron reverse transcriptase/maturase, partial [Acidimicrobiales bacterium]